MSDVLNFYLQKYGVIENQKEDIKIDINDKARHRWELLRKSMGNISEIVENTDLKDNKISHGIQFIRRISHINDIEQAVYIAINDSYLTLDGCFLRIFDCHGRYKNFMPYNEIKVPFSRLEYANGSDRFIAWTPNEEILAMLSPTFEVIEKVDSSLVDGAIVQLFYNEDRNEIVTSHCNKLIIWQFRYANKHLIPQKTISLDHKNKYATIYAIERTQRSHQRLFLANDCSVTVIELCNGVFLANYTSLHERPISALTFFNPLKLLVTGCRDGSIKVWSFDINDIKLNMVFVGHTSSINSLAFFPGGCQATVASCGNDKTVRVWSLELDDEVECLDLEYSPNYIGSDIKQSKFFTLGNNFIDIWCQNHVSDDLMSLSSHISNMELIAENPRKILVTCQNNLLFFIESKKDGKVITKTVIAKSTNQRQSMHKILSTVYLEEENTLLVLLQNNQFLQYNTETHPMLLTSSTHYSSNDDLLLLTAYKQNPGSNNQSQNRNLLLSATSRGWIIVHDITNLENMTFKIEAHSDSAIICIHSDPTNSKLFTSGVDNTIKVWHVYPFALEPLSKILSFFCGLLPRHLTNINNYLFTVFHDQDSAQYPSVVYNINSRDRYDHSPDDDHIEPVNTVSACGRIKLFLSCSAGIENIIKIWTCKNVLLRQIYMHIPVYCAIFSSNKADIFTGIGNQLSFIDHVKYLPKAFIKKQVLMHFEELTDEHLLIDFDNEIFQTRFETDDRDKLQAIKPVFRYQSYADILSEEESCEIAKINKTRKDNFDKIKYIEDDISRIQHGEHPKSHKIYEKFMKKPLKTDIFDLYFSQIVKYHKIPLPLEDSENLRKKTSNPEKYIKSEKEGFFPSHESMSKYTAPENLRKGGYIPNSAILQALWPPKILQDKADTWKPPILSSLDLITKNLSKLYISDVSEEEATHFFDWESDEEPEKVPSPTPTPTIAETISEKLSDDILSKFGSLLEDKQPSIQESKENTIDSNNLESEVPKEVIKRPVTTKLTKANLKLPEISRTPKTMPEIRKVRFISEEDIHSISDEDHRTNISVNDLQSISESSLFITQVPDLENSFNEKKSILPPFLSKFSAENWFIKLCPPPHYDNDCLKLLPYPLNSNTFTMYILQQLKGITDPEDVLGIVNAINYLYSNENIEKKNLVVISSIIESKINEIVQLDTETKVLLLKSCLHLLASLEGVSDKTLVTICLSRLFDADLELKSFLKSILCHVGLEDEADSVEKELENFKLFSVRSGSERLRDLIKIISEWLDKCFQSMTSFAAECREIIGKEIHMIGSQNFKLSKTTMKYLENVKSIFHCHIISPADLVLLYPIEKSPKSILNYINSLNYVRFKKMLKEKSMVKEVAPEPTGPKKTIISLPKLTPNKQFLVRLGESNALSLETKSKKDFINLNAVCNKNVITDYTQHPAMQPFHNYQVALGGGFVPFLHLHLKPCLVNPFPTIDDYIEWENANPKSISKNYQKPFIPQFSLPPEPF